MMISERALVRLLPRVPKPLVHFAASPYIAGPTVDDALSVTRELNQTGRAVTIDVLGEEVSTYEQAAAVRNAYVELIAAIRIHGLDATVSVKPSSLGLRVSYAACRNNLRVLLRCGLFVRLDIEDASLTDDTIRLYSELRRTGYENIGMALQAYLHRTIDDVRGLAHFRPNIRLCKGIYNESSQVAIRRADGIRASYLSILKELSAIDGAHVAIATHDESLIRAAQATLSTSYEFEMLLGVRERRALELATEGHPVRVYVPYGSDWYAYSLRRLQENPAVARAVTRATVTRLFSRSR